MKTSAHILRDHNISARNCFQREFDLPLLVVRRAREQHGKLPFRFGAVDVRAEDGAVAHGGRNVALDGDLVGLSGCDLRGQKKS